jgi:hypothetical protein
LKGGQVLLISKKGSMNAIKRGVTRGVGKVTTGVSSGVGTVRAGVSRGVGKVKASQVGQRVSRVTRRIPRIRRNTLRRKPLDQFLSKAPESIDFDVWESRVNNMYNVELLSGTTAVSILKWVFVLLIGILTACVGVFIDFWVKLLSRTKLEMLYEHLAKEEAGEQAKGTGFGYYALTQAGFVMIACSIVVFGEPMAAGSGIPEIKCMLNGIRVPNAVTLKTLCCKMISVLFSVAGGLPCGKEGPMM